MEGWRERGTPLFPLFSLSSSLPGLRRVEVHALDPVGPLGEAALRVRGREGGETEEEDGMRRGGLGVVRACSYLLPFSQSHHARPGRMQQAHRVPLVSTHLDVELERLCGREAGRETRSESEERGWRDGRAAASAGPPLFRSQRAPWRVHTLLPLRQAGK